MRKTVCILIILCLCLSLAACSGQSPSEKPSYDEPIISADYVIDFVQDYLASESYLSAVSSYEQSMNSKSSGCLVEKAIQYRMKDLDGLSIDALILQLKTDVALPNGSISDTMIVFKDLETGMIYDSATLDIDQYVNVFTGSLESREQFSAILMNTLFGSDLTDDVFFHHYESFKALSSQELASVNQALGLEYRGYESTEELEESIDESGKAIISTDAALRRQLILDMAGTLQGSTGYGKIAYDPTTISIDAAVEFKMDNFEGFPVHALLIHAANCNADSGSGYHAIALTDMDSGSIYTGDMLDMNGLKDIGEFSSMEDIYLSLISGFEMVVSGQNSDIWSENETKLMLDGEDLEEINAVLTESYAARADEINALRLENAASLTELQRMVFDAALEFGNGPRYKQISLEPSSIRLVAASHYRCDNPELFIMDTVLLKFDHVDTDFYGEFECYALKDLESGNVYCLADFDVANWSWDWEDYSNYDDAWICSLMLYEQVLYNGETYFFNGAGESFTHLSAEDIAAVNAALNP